MESRGMEVMSVSACVVHVGRWLWEMGMYS